MCQIQFRESGLYHPAAIVIADRIHLAVVYNRHLLRLKKTLRKKRIVV